MSWLRPITLDTSNTNTCFTLALILTFTLPLVFTLTLELHFTETFTSTLAFTLNFTLTFMTYIQHLHQLLQRH